MVQHVLILEVVGDNYYWALWVGARLEGYNGYVGLYLKHPLLDLHTFLVFLGLLDRNRLMYSTSQIYSFPLEFSLSLISKEVDSACPVVF